MLEARNVRLRYSSHDDLGEDRWTLDVPELCLQANTAYSLLGNNMAGKSTLVRLLTGTIDIRAVQTVSGRLRSADVTTDLPSNAVELRNAGIVGVHQNDVMFPELSIWENVQLGVAYKGRTDGSVERAREMVRATIQQLPRAGLRPSEPLGTLSGGGRALVRMLRSVTWGFRVLFLDEPTANLDPANAERCFSLLEQSWVDDGAVVLVSHSARDHDAFRALALGRSRRHVSLCLDHGRLLPSQDP